MIIFLIFPQVVIKRIECPESSQKHIPLIGETGENARCYHGKHKHEYPPSGVSDVRIDEFFS